MKYFRICANTPYSGTDVEDYFVTENDEKAEELAEEQVEELCISNAESFEYLIGGWDYEPTEEELEDYRTSCEGWYEEISKEEFEENI